MDVIFERENGKRFTMVVEFYDTIQEIKQKIQEIHGIPVSDQTLILNGRVLADGGDTDSCEIYKNSRISLVIAKKTVRLLLKIPAPTTQVIPMEMDVNDTVLNLKKRILEAQRTGNFSADIVVPRYKGQELQDDRTLRECGITENGAEVWLSFSWTTMSKLKVYLHCQYSGIIRVPVWVDPSNKVSVLRKELRRLKRELGFPVPLEYFFTHNQLAMDDDKSFRLHSVGQGDTIVVVIPVSVARGS